MENKLINRDYVSDGMGGQVRVYGDEALLQLALFHLSCRKGGFAPLPDLGSELHLLHRQKVCRRRAFAMITAQKALAPLGLRVCDAAVTQLPDGMFAVTLSLGKTTLEVTV